MSFIDKAEKRVREKKTKPPKMTETDSSIGKTLIHEAPLPRDYMNIPTYGDVIQWLEDHPDHPYGKTFLKNVLGKWKFIVQNTVDIVQQIIKKKDGTDHK